MLTDERIKELWHEVSGTPLMGGTRDFARAVEREARAQERERCAKVAEAYEPRCDVCPSGCADAIRALMEKP